MKLMIATLLMALPLLAGCSAPTDETGAVMSTRAAPESVRTFWTNTVDGRRIPCVWATGYNKGGLSCDWGAK